MAKLSTVSRSDFVAAIEAGIQAAEYDGGPNADALREVGREAKIIGVTYSTGCPVIRAKLVEKEYGNRLSDNGIPSVDTFVRAYDSAMSRVMYPSYLGASKLRIV